MPSLVLIDGGLGQLHAAAEALESLGITSQPLASIAKKEEVIYLYGNEDEPVVLDRRSASAASGAAHSRRKPPLRRRLSPAAPRHARPRLGVLNIPGVGAQTRQRLLTHFGSLRDVQQATAETLAAVSNPENGRDHLAAYS